MHQLEIRNINKVYNSDRISQNVVLENIRFTVSKGEYVSLVGPSGCGKTTLLSIIAGFIPSTSGEILLNGKVIEKPGKDRAFVFQNYALFPWMTVKQNVLYPMKLQKVPKDLQQERLHELLSLAGLTDAQDKYPHELSGGMKQRTAVIRALTINPEVLLLDEPLSAIDYQMRRDMQEELAHLLRAADTTVLMVTHDVEESVFLSDRVIVMSKNRGEIVADHGIALPRTRRRQSKTYQKEIEQVTHYLRKSAEKDSDISLKMEVI